MISTLLYSLSAILLFALILWFFLSEDNSTTYNK
jgi:hypothetical protein